MAFVISIFIGLVCLAFALLYIYGMLFLMKTLWDNVSEAIQKYLNNRYEEVKCRYCGGRGGFVDAYWYSKNLRLILHARNCELANIAPVVHKCPYCNGTGMIRRKKGRQ